MVIEHILVAPRSVAAIAVADAANAERLAETKDRAGINVECVAHHDHAAIRRRDEASVDRSVEVRCTQDTVVDVAPLGVGLAVSQGLDVAGAQEREYREWR